MEKRNFLMVHRKQLCQKGLTNHTQRPLSLRKPLRTRRLFKVICLALLRIWVKARQIAETTTCTVTRVPLMDSGMQENAFKVSPKIENYVLIKTLASQSE